MGHQELPAVRGQDGLHSRCRNLHGPLAPPQISRQCCPTSRGELASHQQEPHAVHGPLLQLRHALHEVSCLRRIQRLHHHGFLQTPLTFHMFVDELCLQLVGDCCTAVHRREARAQQSNLLHLQGVGQHHPEHSPAATGNNLCVVCCAKYNKYLKKHPATAYGNMRRKTTFWCSTCHKYLCLSSTCWSDYHTKVQFWR